MAEQQRQGEVLVELVRLAIVVLLVALGYALGPVLAGMSPAEDDGESARLLTSLVGALVGYLLGGAVGRRMLRGVDDAQQRLRTVDAAVLVAATMGATLAGVVAIVLSAPLLLLPARAVVLPVIVLLVLAAGYAGGRVGAARGGDLGRYVGVRGNIDVSSPSRGVGVKVVDSSALIDGRLVDVARAGFLEGTLVVPRFVLHEMQGLADASDLRRRTAGRRGLDVVRTLQQEHLVVVEVTEDDPPGATEVDGKLAALARDRSAALLTTDSGLRRVAEIAGLKVLDVSVLADAVKPPAAPGDRLDVLLTKEGREPGQGVGYLADGSMVVVERAGEHVGGTVAVEVTSVTQSSRGRMLFAVTADERDEQ